jgi:hypothetical protein
MSVLTSGWPGTEQPRTPAGWSWPAPVLPPRFEGWPRGVRPGNPAEQLLASAIGWWDVHRSGMQPGDRVLRNLGVAGRLLDLSLGSSDLPNSNDPLLLPAGQRGYFYADTAGNALSVPSESGLNPTTSLDLRIDMAPDSWRPAAAFNILAKGSLSASDLQYLVQVLANGTPVFYYTTDGTSGTQVNRNATAAAPQDSQQGAVLRITFDGNAAGNNVTTFYTGPTKSGPWTQLGSTVSVAGTVSLFTGAGSLLIGQVCPAKVFGAQVWNGIEGSGGSLVLDFDLDSVSPSAASFTATTGQTVSIVASATGRKAAIVPPVGRGGRSKLILGVDDYLACRIDNLYQHPALRPSAGEDLSLVFAYRASGSPDSASMTLMSNKGASVGLTPGIALRYNASTSVACEFSDGQSNTYLPTSQGQTPNRQLAVVAAVMSRAARRATFYYNATATQVTSYGVIGSLWPDFTGTSYALRIGAMAGGAANFAAIEFLGAGIFKNRILTPREVSLITAYYGGGA